MSMIEQDGKLPVSIKRLVIDSLKPRETTVVELSRALADSKGVDEVDIIVTEVDARTETTKLTIRGMDIDYEKILNVMKEHSATVRSVDEISVAKAKNLPGEKK